MDVSEAIALMKHGIAMRRAAWKDNKCIVFVPRQGRRLAHFALLYRDSTVSPWVPVQCDLIVDDWEKAQDDWEVTG